MTSDPTVDPTMNPVTTNPSSDPTNKPKTSDPTIDPTSDPIRDPTADPITDPTADPTTDPIQFQGPTPEPSLKLEDANSNLSETATENSNEFYQYVVIGLLALSFLIITASYTDARCISNRRNDFYSASALTNATFQILDVVSDLFFCAEMYSLSFVPLAVAAAAFVVIPSMLSLGQLYQAVQRWRSIGDDMLTAWLFNYAFGLYTFSLLTGNAFSGVQICRSDMFGLPQFAMPLSHNQINEFQSKKLWSTVMLEVECSVHFSICFFGILIGIIDDDCPHVFVIRMCRN